MTFDIKNTVIHFYAKCPICGKNDHMGAKTFEYVDPTSLNPIPRVMMQLGCFDCSELMLCSLDPDLDEKAFRQCVDLWLQSWFEYVDKDPRIHAYNTYRTYCAANGTDPNPYWKFNLDETMEKGDRRRKICNLSHDYEEEEE